MRAIVRFGTRHPRSALAAVALLSALALAGLVDPFTGEVHLRVDPSFRKLLSPDDPDQRALEALQRRFGIADTLVVAVELAGGVFRFEALEGLAELESRLLGIEHVVGVESLASAPWPGPDGDGALAETVLERARERPDRLDEIRRTLLADPLAPGVLVSSDGALAALHVSLGTRDEATVLEARLGQRLREAAEQVFPGAPVWVAGAPYLKAETSRILNRELMTQVPEVLGIMVLVSFAVFRTRTGAWLPVATIGLALLWTLGVMAWTDHALNIVTSIVPPLILVVGFAYTVHVVAEAQALARRGEDARESSGLPAVAFPIALTAATTAVGFLSLGVSGHAAVREFGAFGAVGVLASLLAALGFAPAVLALRPETAPARLERRERRLDRAFAGLFAFDLRHRGALLAVGAAVLVASLWGATRIQVDTRIVDNFRADAPVRRSYERLEQALQGADLLYVLLQGPRPDSLLEPARLREVAAVQRWLADQPEIGGTTSVVDQLEATRRALGGPSPLGEQGSRALVAQLLWLADGGTLDSFLDRERRGTLVIARSRATSSAEIGALVARIEAYLASRRGVLAGSVSGGSVVLTRAVDDVSRDQARSLAAAFGAIFVLLALAFRSARVAAWTLLPNALPVAAYFGTLGFAGIPLDNATALLGCVVLGIAIDDTLHFVARHRRCVAAGASPAAAAESALAEVGRPVTWTTAALCLGLLVLTGSELATQARFGALGAGTLLFAWAVDLLVTPALCSWIRWRPAHGSARFARPGRGRLASVVRVAWRSLALRSDHPGRDGHVVEQSLGGGPQ